MFAKTKQKTTHVESWPSDSSDGEAVSPSSTIEDDLGGNQNIENKPTGLFLI